MTDTIALTERLRFDAIRCEMHFSTGVASNITEAADRIEQLEADNGAYEGGLLKRDFDNDILRSKNARLEALLTEAADDIAEEADTRWPNRERYSRAVRNYNRDMDLPNRIRAALKAGGE
jgi:hypothetical protein